MSGAGIADGSATKDLTTGPTLLAGRGGGRLTPGRHVAYPDETPMANLLLTMLHHMGVPAESIGDSTGAIAHLSEV